MIISKLKQLVAGIGLTSMVLLSGTAHAGAYPERPITIIVPFSAGGPTDRMARDIGKIMSDQLGTPVIVENVAGAGGTIGARKVATAKPDGYTILLHHIGMATAPAQYKNLGYDPLKDFAYIGEVADVPMLIVGSKKLPPQNFQELLAYIKTNPDNITLANVGPGSASHLCSLLFQDAIKQQLLEVPFKGVGPALTDLLGGQVNLMCDQTTNLTAQVHAGGIKAYVTVQPTRVPVLSDVPTVDEAGLPGLNIKIWHAIYAPKGTPPEIVDRLSKVLQVVVADPSYIHKMGELGAIVPSPDRATPEAVHDLLVKETAKWAVVLKNAGVVPN